MGKERKQKEYIEDYIDTKCMLSDKEIEERVKDLRKKLNRKGFLISRNYKTNRVWVRWDGNSSSYLYHPSKIKEI